MARRLALSLKRELEAWREDVQDARHAYFYLNFLSMKQICHLAAGLDHHARDLNLGILEGQLAPLLWCFRVEGLELEGFAAGLAALWRSGGRRTSRETLALCGEVCSILGIVSIYGNN